MTMANGTTGLDSSDLVLGLPENSVAIIAAGATRTHNQGMDVFCTVNPRMPSASGVTYVFVTHVTKIM